MRVWRLGDNVDTDAVAPGRYMKLGIEEIAAHCLESLLPSFSRDVKPGDFVVAGRNFGAGSSREHPPWALTAWGVRAILSTGFADIFRNNSLKNGLLPIVVEHERHRQLFELVAREPDVELTVDLASQVVHLPGDEDLPFDVDPFSKLMLLEGTDELGYLLGKAPSIEAWEAAHAPRVDTRERAGTSD